MSARAVQCPGCHATTSSYPDPHGVRICTYCGTLFKLGVEGPTLVDARKGVASSNKGPAGAIIGVAGAIVVVAGVVVALAVAKSSDAAATTPTPDLAPPSIDFAALTASSSNPKPPGSATVEVAGVAPPPPPKPPLGEFAFHHTRSASGSSFYVLGEIENTGELPLDHPKLIVVLKDEAGKEVGTDFGFAERDIIHPGQKSPISALVSDPPKHASLEYELVLKKASYFPSMVEGLKLDDPKVTRSDWGSGFKAEGKVKNTGTQPAKFVKIEAQGLDAEGKLLGLHTTYADGEVLAPGDSARFSFLSLYFDEEPTKYEFYVSGRVAD